MADVGVVMEKLHSFETADDIAGYFMDYGIKAEPQKARSCAISQFVEIETGYSVCTGSNKLFVDLEENAVLRGLGDYYKHTPAMAEFVQNYDKGMYPELIVDGFKFKCTSITGHCICRMCD
jgi:hypothetical protein